MAELTVANFIQRIKLMQPRDRGHIRAADLIELILQMPEPTAQSIETQVLAKTVSDMMATLTQVQAVALDNSKQILSLKEDNTKLIKVNSELAEDCSRLTEECTNLQLQVDSIDIYLRVNNIEIAGLVDPGVEDGASPDEHVEKLVLDCINGLDMEQVVTSADIDICHELPGRNGNTHVIKFISRKTKNSVLEAKKRQANRQYKFRDNSIYFNDHLTPTNKHIFSLAKVKKNSNDYKYLWTRNGKIFIRKTDNSQVISNI